MKKIAGVLFAITLFWPVCSQAADLDPVLAEVLGQKIHASELEPDPSRSSQWASLPELKQKQALYTYKTRRLAADIMHPLVKVFSADRSINASQRDMEVYLAFYKKSGQKGLERDTAKTLEQIGIKIWAWKTMKALHEEYGGRSMTLGSMNMPVDALMKLAEAQRAKGSFELLTEEAEQMFKVGMDPEARSSTKVGLHFLSEEETRAYYKTAPWEPVVKR